MLISAVNVPQATTSASMPTASPTAAASGSTLVSEQTFLQLLVAQIKNQDPTQPQDGTQFVAQLAQFSSLEQEIQMRQDLDSLASTSTASQNGTKATTQQ